MFVILRKKGAISAKVAEELAELVREISTRTSESRQLPLCGGDE